MQLDIRILEKQVLTRLRDQAAPFLTYHSAEHTKDVLDQANRIAQDEGITNDKQLQLLQIAALYHDTGFLIGHQGHEEKSCELARNDLAPYNVPQEDIEAICSMIMATKLPQSPQNHLEEILCDADLDYLGRDDFETISNRLRHEFFSLGVVKNEKEWMELQLKFIGSHRYFTRTNRTQREPTKCRHLKNLTMETALMTSNK